MKAPATHRAIVQADDKPGTPLPGCRHSKVPKASHDSRHAGLILEGASADCIARTMAIEHPKDADFRVSLELRYRHMRCTHQQ